MSVSKAQQRAVTKYMKSNYEEIKLRVPKGHKAILQEFADASGMSVNSLIYKIVGQELKKDPRLHAFILEKVEHDRMERLSNEGASLEEYEVNRVDGWYSLDDD